MPDVITANRLNDGVVVFLGADGGWSEDFHRGATLSGEAAKAAALEAAAKRNIVVDVYAWIELENAATYVPKALREAIRAAGPTNRRDLGKQAEGQGPRPAIARPRSFEHVPVR